MVRQAHHERSKDIYVVHYLCKLLYTLLHMDAGLDPREGGHGTYGSRNTAPRTYSMMALAL